MSIKRIKELQDFGNEFYNKLLSSEEELSPIKYDNKTYLYEKTMQKSISSISPENKDEIINYRKSLSNYDLMDNKYDKYAFKPIKNKKTKLNKISAYTTLLPWIPPPHEGNYFESFKRLPDHYDMTSWDKVNNIFITYNFLVSNSFMSKILPKRKIINIKKRFHL